MSCYSNYNGQSMGRILHFLYYSYRHYDNVTIGFNPNEIKHGNETIATYEWKTIPNDNIVPTIFKDIPDIPVFKFSDKYQFCQEEHDRKFIDAIKSLNCYSTWNFKFSNHIPKLYMIDGKLYRCWEMICWKLDNDNSTVYKYEFLPYDSETFQETGYKISGTNLYVFTIREADFKKIVKTYDICFTEYGIPLDENMNFDKNFKIHNRFSYKEVEKY